MSVSSADERCVARQLRLGRALGGAAALMPPPAKDHPHAQSQEDARPTLPDVAFAAATPVATAAVTKLVTVLAHLQREQGATLTELVAATGWQPHTTRAMLTGLRKKGHLIERRKRGVSAATIYLWRTPEHGAHRR